MRATMGEGRTTQASDRAKTKIAPEPPTVLVAMSGGVDSSLAAALLVERGYRVIGATMKTFCYSAMPGPADTCCGLEGIRDARSVCDRLGIPHYVFDMEEAFARDVIDDFVDEYVRGRTPNPCVRCNSNTKIPDLLRKGRGLGADLIATGHYARRVVDRDGAVRIRRSVDRRKDQTYFLWGLPAPVVPHLLFPVGDLEKAEVRERARAAGLATADKAESQEICFVPTGDYTEFLAGRIGEDHPGLSPGLLVTREGDTVGEHAGYARYTVGQRRGLGGGFDEPLYVLEVRPETNEVVVGTRDRLDRDELTIGDLNWIERPPTVGERLEVQIRHGARPVGARVDAIDEDGARMMLDAPQRAITPGQSGVLFRDGFLIGGGRIR
ncbi:MAG: tRNA 2-thiouridine(34) synthase MnmA [Gemmatimonadota bacterium]